EDTSAGAPDVAKSAESATSPPPLTSDEVEALLAKLKPPASDIQAALTVIGRRAAGETWPNLQDARIPKAELRGADLTFAMLRGAYLSGANLSGAHMNAAKLSGTDVSGAYLLGTNLH